MSWTVLLSFFFFFNDTATTEIYTLSLHDALPISSPSPSSGACGACGRSFDSHRWRPSAMNEKGAVIALGDATRSEEHTSELQSLAYLVCRLLLEKKKQLSKTPRPWIALPPKQFHP